jgi:nucleotide-binding universal stress UspA family protein
MVDANVVVAAVDDSCVARLVVVEARRLAAGLRGTLRVLHAADAGSPALTPWLADLRRQGVRVERLAGGPAWVALTREASACGAAMLVVGSHGRSGYHPLTPGSTTAKLLVTSPCPLVVVSARHAAAPPPEASTPAEGDVA